MYSRFNDGRKPPTPRLQAHVPSYRQRVRVPPGYRGLAVVDGDENLPANKDFGHGTGSDPRVEGLERLAFPQEVLEMDEEADLRPEPLPATSVAAPEASHPPRGWLDAAHFPFGHGLGTEEWLLIGLILLLLREAGPDRGDLDETVILLGLLLLGG